MKNISFKKVVQILILITAPLVWSQDTLTRVTSPDEGLVVQLKLKASNIFYSVELDGESFLEDSPLGLMTSIGDFTKGLTFENSDIQTISESYELKNAKVNQVSYTANELVATFTNAKKDTLKVVFRVEDNDIAFSYKLIGKDLNTKVKILSEATGFNLPDDATSFITHQALPLTGWEETKPSYEEEYTFDEKLGTPSQYGVGYTFPALFKNAEQGWVLISETGVDGTYPGSRLGESTQDGLFPLAFPQEGENNGIGEAFASMAMPASTPWRTISIGKSLKPIVESTIAFDVVEERYEASVAYKMGKATWSWIVWQDASMNYDDQVLFIDLASEMEFEYILVDANWDSVIGRERFVELVNYAKSKDVEILLWYNSNGFWNNAPQTPQDLMNTAYKRQKEMAWLQEIGVKGIKVDFFGGDKQVTMQLYEDILTDANTYGLAVVFHGCTLPRGWQRMYPNFVSSEAVLASENLVFTQEASDMHAFKSTLHPFIRNSVASMDFGPVFLNKKLSRDQKGGSIRKTTEAFELATGVLYFSPIQHFGLTPNNLEEQPDFVLDFLKEVPTVWDEIVYVGGEPGDYAAIARRKGDKWYIAITNGEQKDKTLELNLPMLKNTELTLIYDAKDRSAAIKSVKVKKNGKVKVDVLGEGGAVLISN